MSPLIPLFISIVQNSWIHEFYKAIFVCFKSNIINQNTEHAKPETMAYRSQSIIPPAFSVKGKMMFLKLGSSSIWRASEEQKEKQAFK